jgi:hypothetical protein
VPDGVSWATTRAQLPFTKTQGTTTVKKNQDTTSVDMVVSRQDYQRPESHKGVGYTMAAYRCSIAHDDIPAAPEAAGDVLVHSRTTVKKYGGV